MDYSAYLSAAASTYPDRAALVFRDTTTTYAELDALVNKLARRLVERGATKAPVAWVAYNEPLVIALALAISRAGGTGVPINARLIPSEMGYILADSGAGTFVVDASFASDAKALAAEHPALERVLVISDGEASSGLETLGELVEGADAGDLGLDIPEETIAVIMYTSGTTGRPKGALRTQRSNLWLVANSALGMHRRREDVDLFNLPVFGIGFAMHIPPMFLAGGSVVLDRIFDPARAWQLLEAHGVTRTFFAPTMLAAMLEVEGHERFDVSSLHTVGVAYEFPRKLRERAFERFGAEKFINMYGLTEAQLFCTKPGEFALDPTSAGTPMGFMRSRIVDGEGRELPRGETGEITLQGPTVMSGYKGMPDETAAALRDGWLHTGDLGHLDAAGNLHFAGRKKEIVKSGGFNVDPTEVENVLLELEGVREAAIVGEPDERWGEAVVGFVVLDSDGPGEDLLEAHCRERLAGFKIPKRFVMIDELPKNPTGKVERGKLRALCRQLPL
jgi:fatty-acyl-CoA synthase